MVGGIEMKKLKEITVSNFSTGEGEFIEIGFIFNDKTHTEITLRKNMTAKEILYNFVNALSEIK